MYTIRPFPMSFRLENVASMTGRNFELKVNPHGQEIARTMRSWFKECQVYDEERQEKFLTLGKFDLFAALSFPDADLEHLETCLAFYFWAFSTDDLADEVLDDSADGAKEDKIKAALNISRSAFDPKAPCPDFPYARMLHHLMRRIRRTATKGTCMRFEQAFEKWGESLIQQRKNRFTSRMPLINEFILMRRNTIGGLLVEAMVEYSLDLDIPDFVFHDPTIVAMSEATNDIMTWPNDLCSFNKEQADGDFSNLVCCIMAERRVELQEAVDILTDMINDRVREYIDLKAQLPSFGAKVDEELGKYLQALEYFVQGTIVWYYQSQRYFEESINMDHEELHISLYPSRNPVPKVVGNDKGNPCKPLERSNLLVLMKSYALYVCLVLALVVQYFRVV